ncbi:MAG: DNA translocase FtsK 4TM domain-containing protein, partial [Thermoanaerobaculia bacterium]
MAPDLKPTPAPSALARRRNEFLGIILVAAGLLLLAALASYHPNDPSLFSAVNDQGLRPRNWAGRFGASFADGSLQFFGLAAFVAPLAILALGVRRFLSRSVGAWGTRGLGVLLVVLTIAPLAHLAFGRPRAFGGGLDAGGFVGDLLGSLAVSALNPPGAAILLSAGLLIGLLLSTSLSLGDGLSGSTLRLSGWWRGLVLERRRRREQILKDRQRREVVKKHLERAKEDAARPATQSASEPEADVVYIPSVATLRVKERAGPGHFSIKKAGGMPEEPSRPVARPALLQKKVEAPQRILPFPAPRDSSGWVFPPAKLLRAAPKRDRESDREEFRQTMELIASKCTEFGVDGVVDAYTPGPVVTTYEFKPSQGVKVSQVTSLENDLALALAAEKVRIERMPGRAAVGIEVPNRNRDLIALREVIESERFRRSPSLLTIALGIDVHGEPVVSDLARMPHLLVAGQTGAGKSVGVTGMITSILFKARPDEVKFIFVDPKMNDMKDYEGLPHLLVPVITDPKKASNALKWAVDEMESRYKLLSEWPGVRNIEQYNAAIRDPRSIEEVKEKLGDKLKADENGTISPMPYIVIVIDELADLMMTAPREIEESVARLAQKARAVGVHLILATQRPSVDVITGTIKANLPCRIAYTTRTRIDSRTILD